MRFARVLAAEHVAEHGVLTGGKTLDFGETLVTVYGLPDRGRPTQGARTRQEP